MSEDPKAYTIQQVAEIMSVTEYTVYKWLRDGELKGTKLKSKWRIMKSDLEEFIRSRHRVLST